MSVRPLLRLPLRHRDGLPAQLRPPIIVESDQRVLEEASVVAVRIVVRPSVRTATLLARDARDDHAVGEVEQELELERLRQIVVEELTLVVDDDALVTLAEAGDDLALSQHLVLAPEDAEVLVHRLRKLVADPPRTLAAIPLEQRLQIALGVRLRGLGHLDDRVRERPVRRVSPRTLAVRD